MEDRHQIFIESMVKMSKEVPEYTEPLKTITKSYIVTEGLLDSIKNIGKKMMTDPAKVDAMSEQDYISNVDKELVHKDLTTFKHDYSVFLDDVKRLEDHIAKYGDGAFMQYISDPKYKFDFALRRGNYIDMLKKRMGVPNMIAEAIDKALMFNAVLECVASKGYMNVATHVHRAYNEIQKGFGVPTTYFVESAFDDVDAILEMVKTDAQKAEESAQNNEIIGTIMPRIAAFIANHGKIAWDKVIKSPKYLEAKRKGEIIRKG